MAGPAGDDAADRRGEPGVAFDRRVEFKPFSDGHDGHAVRRDPLFQPLTGARTQFLGLVGRTVNLYGEPTEVVGMNSGITSIAAGGQHSLAVKNGTVYAWGYNIAVCGVWFVVGFMLSRRVGSPKNRWPSPDAR